jgi:hypothetical protein
MTFVRLCFAADLEIVYDPSPTVGWPSMGTMTNFGVDHGSLSKMLGDSVRTVRIRCFSGSWTNADQVRIYIREILADQKSHTYEAPVWDNVFMPEIECVIEYKNFKHGTWLIAWGQSCFQDSTGKYWFCGHDTRLMSKVLDLPHNKVSAANGNQPINSDTNSTSSATGSRR